MDFCHWCGREVGPDEAIFRKTWWSRRPLWLQRLFCYPRTIVVLHRRCALRKKVKHD